MYKIIEGKKGNRYMKDGKFISKDKIPTDILESLTDDKPVRACAICGKVSSGPRYYNLQTLEACEEHLNNSLGKFAQLLREQENG